MVGFKGDGCLSAISFEEAEAGQVGHMKKRSKKLAQLIRFVSSASRGRLKLTGMILAYTCWTVRAVS